MKNLLNYLAYGRYLARNNAEDGELLVTDIRGIIKKKVIPLFDQYNIGGIKAQYYLDFK